MAERPRQRRRFVRGALGGTVAGVAGGSPQRPQSVRNQTTMAVVFSDIVGSTALRVRMGEVDFTALREAHDALAADVVEACGGEIVRWQGDGLVAAFASAGQALQYASMLQPSVDQLGDGDARFDLRVGIGLGDVLNETTGDLDGPAFVNAARLCDAATPRQVLCTDLVSQTSRALCSTKWPLRPMPPSGWNCSTSAGATSTWAAWCWRVSGY